MFTELAKDRPDQDAPLPIQETAAQLGLGDEHLELYGRHIAKLRCLPAEPRRDGKLILVSAMTTTRTGVGKTVTSIGLGQAFGKLGLRNCVCLRQPSLGPTLGIKGDDPIVDKLDSIARTLYRVDGAEFDPAAQRDVQQLEHSGFGDLPLCIAKTPHSLTDQSGRKGAPKDWKLHVRSLDVSAGAGFIVVKTGAVVTMPGMPRVPGALRLDLDSGGRPMGLF